MNDTINYQADLTTVERLKSMILDHLIICFTIIPVFIIPLQFVPKIQNSYLPQIMFALVFGIYLNKDFMFGRSIAKRITGQIIIDINTKQPADEFKCMIRNLFIPVWIIEVGMVLFNPSRRVGDYLATTKVVRTKREGLKTIKEDFKQVNQQKLLFSLMLAVIYSGILMQIITFIMPQPI